MPRKRIVIDTGILISASIWGGVPREALRKAKEDCVLIFTQDTLLELTRVLSYSKFDAYLSLETRLELARGFSSIAEFAVVTEPIRECEDPNDDIILEAAFYGLADFVIASDKKIAKMHPFRRIPILSPAQYVGANSAV
jgi:putative PIN family toxin of toxin-antitoxin system